MRKQKFIAWYRKLGVTGSLRQRLELHSIMTGLRP